MALVDLPPVAACGVRAALQARGAVRRVRRGLADRTDPGDEEPHVAVLGSRHAQQASPLAGRPAARVVHVVDDTVEAFVAALRDGATAAVSTEADMDLLVQVVLRAAAGQTVVPPDVVGALVAAQAVPRPGLTEAEVAWLRPLAAGATIAAVARTTRVSEREMHRELNRVHARLGVRTRTEALLAAARCGLLREEVS